MSIKHSAEITKTNLILNLDALNKNSYNYTENLLRYSQNFTNSWWAGGSVVITDNVSDTMAPNGTYTATKIQCTNTSFGDLLRTYNTVYTASTAYIMSVYAKAGTARYLGLSPIIRSSYSNPGDPNGGDRFVFYDLYKGTDRKSTRLNSSHTDISRMPSSA